jgi:hypothetical protein
MKLLLEALQSMLSAEQDGERRAALAQIILEISSDSRSSRQISWFTTVWCRTTS